MVVGMEERGLLEQLSHPFHEYDIMLYCEMQISHEMKHRFIVRFFENNVPRSFLKARDKIMHS